MALADLDLLARGIVAGIVILLATEWAASGNGSDAALRFKWSLAWSILRYTLIAATLWLCFEVIDAAP